MQTREFDFRIGDRSLTCLLAEPDAGKLADRPALVVTFSGSRQQSMTMDLYDSATRAFVEAGHRAASFDLPNHGQRRGPHPGNELAGLCAMFFDGNDPFAAFVTEGKALIDAAIAQGLATPGRVYAYGVSRGGYCALRLTAADERIAGVAAIAPVVDWRVLTEFAGHKVAKVGGDSTRRDDPRLESLALVHLAPQFARRHVYAAIGFRDLRVGTDLCTAFMAEVVRAQSADPAAALTEYHIDPQSQGHGLDRRYYPDGARFLVERVPVA